MKKRFEDSIDLNIYTNDSEEAEEVEIKGETVLSYDDAMDSKQNRSMIALAAGLLCLLFSG